MEREEAIKVLDEMFNTYDELHENTDGDLGHEQMQALQMAIESLSNYTTKKPNDEVEQGNDVVVEPTDLISRADAIEAVEDGMCTFYDCDVLDRINAVPSAKAVKVAYIYDGRKCDVDCSDCFRTLDIEHAKDFKLIGGVYYQEESADRPSGEWIKHNDRCSIIVYYTCSECGEVESGTPPYCRKCGAKMGSGGLYYADNRLAVKWKPVSEGLPQSVGSYIVTCKDEYGSVYVDYDFWTVADKFKYNRDKVTAWIPFPKPYEGGENE